MHALIPAPDNPGLLLPPAACRLLTQFLPGSNRELYLALHEAAVQPEALLRDLLDAATQWQQGGCNGQAQVALVKQISPQVRTKAEALGLAAVADPGKWQSAQGQGLLFKVSCQELML